MYTKWKTWEFFI